MAGLSKEGFKTKRQIEVIRDLKEVSQPIFQDLVPVGDVVDTSDSSTLGRIIGLYSDPISELWELAQAVYLAFDPDSATGTSLDDIVAYGGLVRKIAYPTRAEVYVWGKLGTLVSDWNMVRSSTTAKTYKIMKDVEMSLEQAHGIKITPKVVMPNAQYQFWYKPSGTYDLIPISVTSTNNPTPEGILQQIKAAIDLSHPNLYAEIDNDFMWVRGVKVFSSFEWVNTGLLDVASVITTTSVECTEAGSFEQEPDTINLIAVPSYGWEGVSNPLKAIVGRSTETDEELRERFRKSKYIRATNIIEALYSEIDAVDGVDNLIIYENIEDCTDERGLPPHSFSVIVEGGLESEIAKAIWQNRPAGIKDVGTEEHTILDAYGFKRLIRFSRPVPVEVKVRMNLTRFHEYPADGDDLIKEAIIEWGKKSVDIGKDLIFSRLYTPINSIKGHQVDNLEVSLDGEYWFSGNIKPLYTEKISFREENIAVL